MTQFSNRYYFHYDGKMELQHSISTAVTQTQRASTAKTPPNEMYPHSGYLAPNATVMCSENKLSILKIQLSDYYDFISQH